MKILEDLARRLRRYTKKCISDAFDPDFADAVYEAAGLFARNPEEEIKLDLIQHVGYSSAECGYEK